MGLGRKSKSIKHEKPGTCREGSFRFTPIISHAMEANI